MKKLLTLLIAITLIIGLGACVPSQDNSDLEERITALETRVDSIEVKLDNLTVMQGLNGQYYVYYNDQDKQDMSNMFMSTTYPLATSQYKYLSTFDSTNAPQYILDEMGQFIEFEDVAYMLKSKYFGADNVSGYEEINGSGEMLLKFMLPDGEYNDNEIFAQTVLMIKELSNYEFYIIDGTSLTVRIAWLDGGGIPHILLLKIEMTYLLNQQMFEINADAVYNQEYDITYTLDQIVLNYNDVMTAYQDYIDNATYTGYVLNYTP